MNIRAIDNYSVKPSTLKRITQIERFTGTWIKLDSIQPAIIEELQKANIVTSSGASTRIEGALLSDNEVESLINQGCKITRISSRSEREVVGYVRALKFIYQDGRSLPVTEHSIRSLHQLMTADFTSEMLPEKQRGVYKTPLIMLLKEMKKRVKREFGLRRRLLDLQRQQPCPNW